MPLEDVPTGYSKRSISMGSACLKPVGHWPLSGNLTWPAATSSPGTITPSQQLGKVTCRVMMPLLQLAGMVGLPETLLSEQPHHVRFPQPAPCAFAPAADVAML